MAFEFYILDCAFYVSFWSIISGWSRTNLPCSWLQVQKNYCYSQENTCMQQSLEFIILYVCSCIPYILIFLFLLYYHLSILQVSGINFISYLHIHMLLLIHITVGTRILYGFHAHSQYTCIYTALVYDYVFIHFVCALL